MDRTGASADGGELLRAAQLAQAIEADFGHLLRGPAGGVVDYELDDEDEDEPTSRCIGKKRKWEAAGGSGEGGEREIDEDETRVATRARGAGGPCESCGGEGRYRCPRCDRRSCGVACVRRHKEETGCSGIRDRTAFVPLRGMTDSHLHSDFNFLQDCMRVADVTHLNRPKMNAVISKRFRIFLYQCRRRRIRVHLLPQGMSKRKQNTSYYNIKDDKMLWRVEWRFPYVDNAKLFSDRVPENHSLHEALRAVLLETKHNATDGTTQYAGLPIERLRILMRVERLPANEEKYYLLSADQSLKSALENTELVEFPTFHVLSDDELMNSGSSTFTIVSKMDMHVRGSPQDANSHNVEHQGNPPSAIDNEAIGESTAQADHQEKKLPAEAQPTGQDQQANDEEEEEEGFSFATLVDY